MPFQQIELAAWRLAVDVQATQQAHEQMDDICACGYCRNFLAVQPQLAKEYHQILRTLGVDSAKPANITEYTQNPDGLHFYSWWYHMVGYILDYDQAQTEEFGTAAITPDIELTIEAKAYLAPADFPEPMLQIEFFSNIPWVLDEALDSAI